MTRRKKIFLAVIALVVLSQLPFAYRRYRLYRLAGAIVKLAAERLPPEADTGLVDYQGVIHIHSSLGGHSTGSLSDIVSAAKLNALDFVIMTEHPQPSLDTSALTLNGVHDGVLFINGNEVSTVADDRLLLVPGDQSANLASTKATEDLVSEQRARHGLAIAAYPNDFHTWPPSSIDGVEVYNLFTNARATNRVVTFFDALWAFGGYSDLVFANFFSRPDGELRRWDDANASGGRRLFATAGNDAHANIGLSVNDSGGNQLLGIKLDPYERSFLLVRTHVLIEKGKALTRESLVEAIAHGHSYISFDVFADPKGFTFSGKKSSQTVIMGDEVALGNDLHLKATAPILCRFVLLKDGRVVNEKSGAGTADFEVHEKGAYRVEVYADSLPAPAAGKPWIISNPIYVR